MLVTMTAFAPTSTGHDNAGYRPVAAPSRVREAELSPAAREWLAQIHHHEGEPLLDPPLLIKLTLAYGFGTLALGAVGIVAWVADAAGLVF